MYDVNITNFMPTV